MRNGGITRESDVLAIKLLGRMAAGLALALAAVLIIGCNTTQTPGSQTNDLQITAQVKTNLASQVDASSLTNIEVNTTNGVVTLAGEVATEEIKQKAETVASAVQGVVEVNNNLQVAAASLAP